MKLERICLRSAFPQLFLTSSGVVTGPHNSWQVRDTLDTVITWIDSESCSLGQGRHGVEGQRPWAWFPAPTQWLISSCNCSSKGSDALFWPPCTLHSCVLLNPQHTHYFKRFFKKNFFKRRRSFLALKHSKYCPVLDKLLSWQDPAQCEAAKLTMEESTLTNLLSVEKQKQCFLWTFFFFRKKKGFKKASQIFIPEMKIYVS